MPPKNNKPKGPVSNILGKKAGGEDEILFPTPTLFDWQNKTYKVKPMPDAILRTLGVEFNQISALFVGVARSIVQNTPEGQPVPKITPAHLLPYLPDVMGILLPCATRIIAGCLRIDEEIVADDMSLGKKTEALRLILEAEDLPLLLENFPRLMGMFNSIKATSAEMNAETDEDDTDDEDDLDETDPEED